MTPPTPSPRSLTTVNDSAAVDVHTITCVGQARGRGALIHVPGWTTPPRRRWVRALPLLAVPAGALLRLLGPVLVALVWLVALPAVLLVVTGHAGVIGLADQAGPVPWLFIAAPVGLMAGFCAAVWTWTRAARRHDRARSRRGHPVGVRVVHVGPASTAAAAPPPALEGRRAGRALPDASDNVVDDLALQLLGVHLLASGREVPDR